MFSIFSEFYLGFYGNTFSLGGLSIFIYTDIGFILIEF